MKSMHLLVMCFSFLVFVGLSTSYAQDDALKTLEQSLERPAESQETGYLGMAVDLMAPDGKSVYIVEVSEGGPAAKAGLKANDVIAEINGKKIGGLQDLDGVVRQPPGSKLVFKVRRNDVPQRFEVILGRRSGQPARDPEVTIDELPPPAPPTRTPRDAGTPAPRTDGGPPIIQDSKPQLGITVADAERLSDADKRRFGVEVDTGAVISGIKEGAPAALAGLPIGGVVVSINGKRIGNAQDIVDLVRTFRPGQNVEVTYWEGDRVGRKQVRVGRTAVAVTPAAPSDAGTTRAEPGLRLRGRSDRPILNLLEQVLDDVLPPGPGSRSSSAAVTPPPPPPGDSRTEAGSESMVPPPPPPRPDNTADLPEIDIEPPAVEMPEPRAEEDVEQLRKQAVELQKQLDVLLRRIQELEKKKR